MIGLPRPIRVAVLAVAVLGGGCRRPAVERAEGEFLAMGGIPIRVIAYDVDPAGFERFVSDYRVEVQRLEALLSVHRMRSVISRLNASAGRPFPLDAEVAGLLRESLALAAETGGAFDPTVGPLAAAWKEAARAGAPPAAEALADARRSVGWALVRVEGAPGGGAVVTLPPGGSLDLGGVAKGWMADVGVRLMRARGMRRGLVEIGGDLSAFDDRPVPASFAVGVRDPSSPGELLGRLRVDGGSAATSGDYERGYDVGGRRYNHIFDPRTGLPVAAGLRSVTLLAPTGARADALATAVMVMGEKEGMAFVERTDEVEALLVIDAPAVPGGRRVVLSAGLRERFDALP